MQGDSNLDKKMAHEKDGTFCSERISFEVSCVIRDLWLQTELQDAFFITE